MISTLVGLVFVTWFTYEVLKWWTGKTPSLSGCIVGALVGKLVLHLFGL